MINIARRCRAGFFAPLSPPFAPFVYGPGVRRRTSGRGGRARRRSNRSAHGSIPIPISVVSGNLNGTYLTIAYDLSAVLDDGDNLRVLPIIGKGGGQNIRDVRFLKGVDIGITQSNLLSVFRRTNEIGQIDDKIVYIARLFNEELHLVVRAEFGHHFDRTTRRQDRSISATSEAARSFHRATSSPGLASKSPKSTWARTTPSRRSRSGEIAASMLIAGKPTGSTAKLKAADGFRILPVAFSKALQDDYLPTTFTHDDYPGLIEPGQQRRQHRGWRGADRLQLAAEHRSLSAHRQVRRCILPEDRRIPEGAAPSEMARGQPRRHGAEHQEISGGRGVASAPIANLWLSRR